MKTRNKELIKVSEGLSLVAYLCPAGVLTIGYGHTGKDVVEGMVIDHQEADRLLQVDLEKFEKEVSKLVKVGITQNQFDALISFTYNLGASALKGSTLLKKLNAGEYMAAANEFPKWVKAGGKVLPGLVTRRRKERELFLEGYHASQEGK